MITVTLNRTEFEYDIHSLIKAFFPKEDVELYYTKEAHADEKNVACTNHSAEQEEAGSSHFSIDYADDRISIAWDDAPDGPARRTFAVDFSNRTETKNALKEHLGGQPGTGGADAERRLGCAGGQYRRKPVSAVRCDGARPYVR